MNRFEPKSALYSARPHTGLFLTAIVAAFALILTACSLPYCPVAPESTTTGGFSLSPRGSDGRTIIPTDLSVSNYSLSGSGPNGVTLPAQDSTTGDFTVTGLASGDWALHVEGSDSDGNIVLSGDTQVSIAAGKTTNATITLLPATGGTGTLSLSVAWTVTDRTVKAITASLAPTGGTAIPLDFTITDATASCTKTGLAPGSYLLTVALCNDGVRVARVLTEAVIVYGGKISQWAETLAEADFGPDYRVLYDANGAETGTAPADSFRYATGVTVTAATGGDLAKDNTTFVGWNTKANGSGTCYAPGATFAMGSADVTLYAMWNTVIYDGSGNTAGSVPVEQKTYATGDTVTVLGNTGNLVCDGFVFSGWIDYASGTTYQPGDTFTKADGIISLSAVWRTGYTLSYDANGADSGTVPATFSCLEGDTVTIAANDGNLVRAGYIFAGWNTDPTGNGANYSPGLAATTDLIMPVTTMTLYAKWTPVYTVVYDGNGSTGGSVPVDGNSYVEGAQYTVSDNTGNLVKAGYIFAGWNSATSGTETTYTIGTKYTMGTANRVIYAKWTPVYTVTYDGNGNTGGSVPVDGNTYLSATKYTTLANTGNLEKTGYIFAGWNDSASGTGTQYATGVTRTLYANVKLYARWVPKVVAISADGDASFFVTETGDVWGTGSVLSPVNALSSTNTSTKPIRIRTDGARIRFFWEMGYSYYNAFALVGSDLSGIGTNMTGSLGVGNAKTVSSVTTIATDVGAIAGNYRETLILKNDGSLVAAGANPYGELATGNSTQSSALVTTLFTGEVKAIAMGWAHALILKNDGILYAVGMNSNGQLGTGNTTDTVTPVPIATGVAAIAACESHSFYITTAGDLYGFGDNSSGEIGNGTTSTAVKTPYLIAGNVAAVEAGASSTFFITTAGELKAMGDNTKGQLGTGDTTDRTSPTSIIASGVKAVATGGWMSNHTIALMNDGSVKGLGSNTYGELGLSSTSLTYAPTQIIF